MSSVSVQVYQVPSVIRGVSDDERDVIAALFREWQAKFPRNVKRSAYFDGKMPLRPTGNIPAESMQKIRAWLYWPEKAVTALSERSVFEGCGAPGFRQDPFALESILDANRFDLELPQAITSAYKHSCSFVTTALGDVE